MDKLKKLRDRIDWLDTQIASLLNERMRAADQIGKIKRDIQQDVADQSREIRVLNQVKTIIQHPVLKENIPNIYNEIMQISRTGQQFFQHISQPFRRIGIIGMGLIGGSICKGIKTKDSSVEIGTLFHESEDVSLAKTEGWVDQVYSKIGELVHNSELIILASPVSTITQLAEEIKPHTHSLEKITIIDVASVKGDIIETFEKLTCKNVEYISTHPMAGKEKGGFKNSQATLFVNRPWVIVTHKENSNSGIESIKEFILYLGSNPILSEAKVHDQQAALISHLPSILSKLYYDFVKSIDAESMIISGPGFQSFTRLAHENNELRKDVNKYNQKAIHNYLNQWLEFLKENKGL